MRFIKNLHCLCMLNSIGCMKLMQTTWVWKTLNFHIGRTPNWYSENILVYYLQIVIEVNVRIS